MPPHESWSDLERWVWHEIGSRRVADINAYLHKSADAKPDDWGPERRIRAAFLETILLHDPWRSVIPRQGVCIVGALFDETVDLGNADIAHEFWLVKSRFTSDVYLHRIRTESLMSLDGSVISGTLNLDSARIGGSLFMREGAEFAEVNLLGANIGGQLNLSGAKVNGTLDMDSAKIRGSLLMGDGADFMEIDLRNADIKGQLNLSGSKVAGMLDLNATKIGGSLLMRDKAEFAEVAISAEIGRQLDLSGSKVKGMLRIDSIRIGHDLCMSDGAEFSEIVVAGANIWSDLDLCGAKIKGAVTIDSVEIGSWLLMDDDTEIADVTITRTNVEGLSLNGANIKGALHLEAVNVRQSLFMRDAEPAKGISLQFSAVGANVDLRGTTIADLDLTGTRVEGELRLASADWQPTWAQGAALKLRNVRVAALKDEPEAWPNDLDLGGFTYELFGGLGSDAEIDVGSRGYGWFKNWLARDEPYRPQPYHQCAKVLRQMGHREMADDVLYAGRERERKEAWQRSKWRWFGLSLLNWTIGYGYGLRYFRSVWWVLRFVIVGTLVLLGCDVPRKLARPITWATASGMEIFRYLVALAFYSFDLLLPIIQLYEPHYKVVLDGFAKYYFAAHKLVGYVLASFLIAGLAGLTK